MKITIKTIAEKAGVSVSTVSKIINQYPEVSEDTKERVQQVMQELGYQPPRETRAKAITRSNLIGIVFAGKQSVELNNLFFIDIINAFKKKMGILGFDLLLFTNESFHNSGKDYLERCTYYQVDGCLVIAGEELESSIRKLSLSSIPCIGVDIELSGQQNGYIMSDNIKISHKVVEHFYLHGYKSIGFIGGAVYSHVSRLREDSFRSALASYGLRANNDWIVHGDTFYEESGYQAMKEMIASGSLPQAIFAASDLLAIGAMTALRESGYRVPQDVAIIGCDDIHESKYMDPPLTTTKQDREKMGLLAAMMLYDLINNQLSSSSVLVEPELIVRGSCGCAVS